MFPEMLVMPPVMTIRSPLLSPHCPYTRRAMSEALPVAFISVAMSG